MAGLKSWKAVKQILHFMSEANPSAFSEISLQAPAPGEQWEPRDKWGTPSVLQAICVTRSKSSCFGRSASAAREQDQFSPGLTKDPSLLMAVKPEEKLNEVDAEG